MMAVHYQFFRELLLAVELGGIFVLLHDQRSPVFHSGDAPGERGLIPFLLGIVPQPIREKMVTVTIQEVVAAIREHDGHGWIQDFVVKYGLE